MKKPRPALYARHRFPLSLRMVEKMLAARGIEVSHETVRRWAETFGREFANRVRRRLPRPGDCWHLDAVVITLQGRSIGSGGPWIRTALSWMSCSRAVETAKQPSACCASC